MLEAPESAPRRTDSNELETQKGTSSSIFVDGRVDQAVADAVTSVLEPRVLTWLK